MASVLLPYTPPTAFHIHPTRSRASHGGRNGHGRFGAGSIGVRGDRGRHRLGRLFRIRTVSARAAWDGRETQERTQIRPPQGRLNASDGTHAVNPAQPPTGAGLFLSLDGTASASHHVGEAIRASASDHP